jgi:hypothetical protein
MSRTKDSHGTDIPFPVMEERTLPFIQRRFLRGARRDPGGLPAAGPGTVLVFLHGSRYEAIRENRHLTGTEDLVVDATAVFLVDIRARDVTIYFSLPSANAADDFTVRISFQAHVTDPERAAAAGAIDLEKYLERYLQQDAKLSKLGSDYPIEAIAAVRDVVISRIEAYCEFNPITLTGLEVVLAAAAVLTPRELRRHEQDMRDERRRQALAELRNTAEDRSIQRHQALVESGPAALTALGLTRGETPVNDAIDHARDDEHRQQDQFAQAFRILQQTGGTDFIDIDPTDMVAAYLEKLTGQPITRRQRDGTQLRGGDKREAITAGDDPDEDLPDEDGLDD